MNEFSLFGAQIEPRRIMESSPIVMGFQVHKKVKKEVSLTSPCLIQASGVINNRNLTSSSGE